MIIKQLKDDSMNEYMICLSYETEGAKYFHTVYIMMLQNVTICSLL